MINVLISPTAFKGSLSPLQVAQAIADGLRQSGRSVNLKVLPLADGGDGTIESLQFAVGGRIERLEVAGPLGKLVEAGWLDLDAVAVVELAAASGIALLKNEELAPLAAHTEGTGELLRDCMNHGKKNIIVTVGGSASTDGGAGILKAFDANLLDAQGQELPLGGGFLHELERLDLRPLKFWQEKSTIRVAADVSNPLLGATGAAAIFAPQKGAAARDVLLLEKGLQRWADLLEKETAIFSRNLPGAGAAGGTAFGLACAFGAQIISGFNWIANMLDLDRHIADCHLVVTAEGKLDGQSLQGKVIGQLIKRVAAKGLPLWVVAAQADAGIDWQKEGISVVSTVARDGYEATAADIASCTEQLARRLLP